MPTIEKKNILTQSDKNTLLHTTVIASVSYVGVWSDTLRADLHITPPGADGYEEEKASWITMLTEMKKRIDAAIGGLKRIE